MAPFLGAHPEWLSQPPEQQSQSIKCSSHRVYAPAAVRYPGSFPVLSTFGDRRAFSCDRTELCSREFSGSVQHASHAVRVSAHDNKVERASCRHYGVLGGSMGKRQSLPNVSSTVALFHARWPVRCQRTGNSLMGLSQCVCSALSDRRPLFADGMPFGLLFSVVWPMLT